MAKIELHDRALQMRKLGMSYSQIKKEVGVSKGTLSVWLKEFPLSEEGIRELRDRSEMRIERCRETKAIKRKARTDGISKLVQERIGIFSDRELFLAGLLLYWAEGTKAQDGRVVVTNTDPKMIKMFLCWISLLEVSLDKLKVRLHLYSDMDVENEINFWATELVIPKSQFRKPYIKKRSRIKERITRGDLDTELVMLHLEIEIVTRW